MGEAIARFRELALAIRLSFDEHFSQPSRTVTAEAAERFAKDCRRLLSDYEQGWYRSAGYLRSLDRARQVAEKHAVAPPPGMIPFPEPVPWLPVPVEEVPRSVLRRLERAAIKEAVRLSALFPVVEARIKSLAEVSLSLQGTRTGLQAIRAARVSMAPGAQAEACESLHARWKEAFESLAPFVDESPKATDREPQRPQPRSRKGIGGRRDKWPKELKRQILADHAKYLKQMKRLRKKPLRQTAWVSTVWALDDGREMKRKDALALWNAAKREKQRRQTH
jgi:hypothetical protein